MNINNFKYDPLYHRFADRIGIDRSKKENARIAQKLFVLYDWAKTKTKSEDFSTIVEHIDKTTRSNGVSFTGETLVNFLYERVRMSADTQHRKEDEDKRKQAIEERRQKFEDIKKKGQEFRSDVNRDKRDIQRGLDKTQKNNLNYVKDNTVNPVEHTRTPRVDPYSNKPVPV